MPFSLRLALEVLALVGRLLLPANQGNLTTKMKKTMTKNTLKNQPYHIVEETILMKSNF